MGKENMWTESWWKGGCKRLCRAALRVSGGQWLQGTAVGWIGRMRMKDTNRMRTDGLHAIRLGSALPCYEQGRSFQVRATRQRGRGGQAVRTLWVPLYAWLYGWAGVLPVGFLDGGTASAIAWRALRGAMRLAQVRLPLVARGDAIRSRCSLSGALRAPIDALGDSLTGMEEGRCTDEPGAQHTGLVGLHGVQMGFCESALGNLPSSG